MNQMYMLLLGVLGIAAVGSLLSTGDDDPIDEGTPVTLLEAMACGLPVVATKVGGIPEVVQEGVNGALVPASNAQALAAALGRYVDDASLVTAHGAGARLNIERHYSVAAMVGAYTALYDRLSNTKTTPRGITEPCAE